MTNNMPEQYLTTKFKRFITIKFYLFTSYFISNINYVYLKETYFFTILYRQQIFSLLYRK